MTIAGRRHWIRARNRMRPALYLLALLLLGWLMVATTIDLGTRVAAATIVHTR